MKTILLFAFLLLISNVWGQTYHILQGYEQSDCGGSPVAVVSSLTGLCYRVQNDVGAIEYHKDQCNSTTATDSIYSTSCVGTPNEVVTYDDGECASQTVQKIGQVAAVSSCADEKPVLTGNIITATYYSTLDCSGTPFYEVQFNWKWVDCLGGIKLNCNEKQYVEADFCAAADCSSECSSVGALPSGTCIPDDNVPGTSFTFGCTSGSTSLLASIALVLASFALILF